MVPGSPPGPGRRRALEALLVDLGPQLRRGPQLDLESADRAGAGPARAPDPASTRIASGYGAVDELVGGGFPVARLCEICGPASSGRTSLALGLLATVTSRGELAAVVDAADAFDPLSAEAVGVDLDRVLWARAPAFREALRCCERLLETDGIPLVLLDVAGCPTARSADQRTPGEAAWLRLGRRTRTSRAALIVLSRERLTGSHAEVALEMQRSQARFSGTPQLLEELEIHAVLARHRALPTDRTVRLTLGTRAA